MEKFQNLFCAVSLILYLLVLLFSFLIIFTVLSDKTLHEPMYTFIAYLLLNGIFGTSTFYPKLITDLLLASKVISRIGCFIQIFAVTLFAYGEISTFTIMAYDTYLAVCHPLQYPTLMSNFVALKLIGGSLAINITSIFIGLLISATIPLCGSEIKNIYCDNLSILTLSCVETSGIRLYGTINFSIYLSLAVSIVAYSYFKILHICFKVSKDSCKKAIHTLVTHVVNFLIFMIGVLFIFVRYRLDNINLPLVFHLVLSVTGFVFPPLLSPLIYGLRTQMVKKKVINLLKNWTHL
ncbi:hypothetical protein GDO86_020526 [Hymenochirus boettgeri]|uniref:G-protein coupled receptors family 1 profile domain-containing protein n=1 Tax=Hymenochirus boettgeri TaxID=247094 RepID=A0A8T2IIN7_9PIPI|nr:hypothetical protein GDO86_020526 [Hymenochirus boettgeri]